MCNEYNGHTNYPTWNASLWLDNDYGTYGMFLARAREILEADDNRYTLADEIAEHVKEGTPETTGMAADLLGWTLGQVDWREVADSFFDTAAEEIKVDAELA